MIFHSLSLQGFKKYTEKTFDFLPGLNLFVGPNESGKTTLHQGIMTALYGFGSKEKQLLKGKESIKPWQSIADSQVGINFSLDQNRYLLKRDLDSGANTLYRFAEESDSYETLTADRQKIEEFLAQNIGIPSAEVFNQTISVQQGQVNRMHSLGKVGEAVEELFTGKERRSVRKVVEKLHTQRKELKKERNEKPGKIDELTQQLAEVVEKIVVASQQQAEKTKVQQEMAELGSGVPEAKARLEELNRLVSRYEAQQDAKRRLSSLTKRYEELSRRLKSLQGQQDSVREVQLQWKKYSSLQAHESDFEELLLTVRGLEKVQGKLHDEEERLEKEKQQQQLVVVHNDGWLYAPGAIWAAIGMAVASIIGAVVFTQWWLLLFVVVAVGWGVLIFKHGVVDQFNVTDIRSEYYQQLVEEERQEQRKALSLVQGMKIDEKLLQDAEALRLHLQEYYRVKEEWRQKNATLEVLHQSEDYDGVEREKEEIGFALRSVKKELEIDQDFHPTAEEVERWKQEIENTEKKLPFQQQQWNLAQGRVEQMNLQDESYEDLTAERDYLQGELLRLTKRHEAVELAQTVLGEVVEQYRFQCLPVMQERASEYIAQIASNAVGKLDLVDKWPEVSLMRDGVAIPPENLSMGSLDQLYFSLRLAASDVMSKELSLPLILDDPFVNFDDDRYESVLDLLVQIARTRQVLYFTCRSHIPEIVGELVYDQKEVNTVWMS